MSASCHSTCQPGCRVAYPDAHPIAIDRPFSSVGWGFNWFNFGYSHGLRVTLLRLPLVPGRLVVHRIGTDSWVKLQLTTNTFRDNGAQKIASPIYPLCFWHLRLQKCRRSTLFTTCIASHIINIPCMPAESSSSHGLRGRAKVGRHFEHSALFSWCPLYWGRERG